MPADPSNTDPADRNPHEAGLERRSSNAAVNPWLVVGVIALLAVGVYVVLAVL